MSAIEIALKVTGLIAFLIAWEFGFRETIVGGLQRAAQRRIAARRAEAMRANATRIEGLKARIVAVGSIEHESPDTIFLGLGWHFDNTCGAPIHSFDSRGVYRYLGYTLAEIREIHARRDEFADRPNV